MIEITARIIKDVPPGNCTIITGGDPSNPTWDEYLSQFTEEWQPHIKAIRTCVEESPFMRSTGSVFCNGHYFQLSDGSSISFTWRAWGDLMQAIIGKCEGYMTYYM
jgi:hypothetical protein